MDRIEETLFAQLGQTLKETHLPELGVLYRGKVRDVYRKGDRLIIITTDRISAFDVVLGTVPFKGEILNAMARAGFETTRDIVPNHVISTPDPNVVVARACTPYPIEFVARQYITGSLWRDYQSGAVSAYGLSLSSGLRKDQRLDGAILTPTTKAHAGHDQPISPSAIVSQELMSTEEWEEAQAVVLSLFERGSKEAAARGLILVDTKYELGRDSDGQLRVIDEIHTPDCSRYWISETYEERFARGEPQEMLDKENLRGWLMEQHGYRGNGPAPVLTEDIRLLLTRRYMEAHARMLGRAFEPRVEDVTRRVTRNLEAHGLLAPRGRGEPSD